MPRMLECPHCGKPMHLTSGNPIFSYWECLPCKKAFEFNVWTEKFTDEEDMRSSMET